MKRLAYLLLALAPTLATMSTPALVSCRRTASQTANTIDGRLPRAETSETAAAVAGVDALLEAAARAEMDIHSVMVLQHGSVVAEKWQSEGAPDTPHILNSVSKSFTATAVGFAIAEGRLRLDDKVVSFFPDKLPAEPAPHLASMTIRDLLTMSTGQAKEPSRSGRDWVADFLAAPIENVPGTVFKYNSMATFMLSAIVQKVSGQKLADYLQTRLFGPLEIEDYRWNESPDGINTGGWGLYLKTEALARFGQLFLQKGVWNGERLLPEGWAEEASSWKIASGPAGNEASQNPDDDWAQGYCYQMWRCRHNAFRADGASGQFIIVIPESDAVVVLTADVRDMQAELNLVWEYILPTLES